MRLFRISQDFIIFNAYNLTFVKTGDADVEAAFPR
jgi:hypothetical protein